MARVFNKNLDLKQQKLSGRYKEEKKNRTIILHLSLMGGEDYCTRVRFASFLSGRFITVIVAYPPEKKLAKRTSVYCD